MTPLTSFDLANRVNRERPGPARDYLKLELLIATATDFAESIGPWHGDRAPVEVELTALLDAVAQLKDAVRKLAR